MKLITLILITISIYSYSQSVSVIKIFELEKRVKNNSDTTYIVNFWATWCVPCVKELPAFDSIKNTYQNTKTKILLVSMDFKEDLTLKLLPFLSTKKIKSEVVLLDETNANYFIPMISNEWSGALPATWIFNNQKKINHFFEKKINFEFLKNELDAIIKN
jgi:thiol-disulfide isomerase/thioredoxin